MRCTSFSANSLNGQKQRRIYPSLTRWKRPKISMKTKLKPYRKGRLPARKSDQSGNPAYRTTGNLDNHEQAEKKQTTKVHRRIAYPFTKQFQPVWLYYCFSERTGY